MKYKRLFLDSAELGSPADGDAGYDLPIYGDVTLEPGGKVYNVKTGVAVEIPNDHVGIVFGRSGNAFKKFVHVIHQGVIDESYRGEINVQLQNNGEKSVAIIHGERIAQLVVFRVYTEPAQEAQALSDTERGSAGLGSTGLVGGLSAALRGE